MTPGGEGVFHDPFADHESQEDEVETGNKEKIEFSYASYMRELSKEEILNNTDESIFSSLADLAGTGRSMICCPRTSATLTRPSVALWPTWQVGHSCGVCGKSSTTLTRPSLAL